jgi:hypothetical protein
MEMQTSGDQRREKANSHSAVITREADDPVSRDAND